MAMEDVNSSLCQAVGIKARLSRMCISHQIVWGYGLALSLAIVGTMTGLVIGNYFHQQAKKVEVEALNELQLLDHLHNSVLQTRLHRLKLAVVLDKPDVLKAEYANFLHHLAEFEKSWAYFVATEGYTQSEVTHVAGKVAAIQQFLQTYQQVPNNYFRAVNALLQALNLPRTRAEEVALIQDQLNDFAFHPAVDPLASFSQDLLTLVEQSHQQYQQAEQKLIAAQALRTQWVTWSMLGSIIVASLSAFYTSRAIANPLHTLTTVTQRITQESNFELQAPVTSDGEVGMLAIAFNQLIERVNQLLQAQVTIQRKLEHDAMHDALTGLPNRLLFHEQLNHAIALNKRQPEYGFAVLFLDLDQFKSINDRFGHHLGDQLLIEVAHRLQTGLRTVDTACRLGGDEFAILLEAISNADEVITVVNRIQASLTDPFHLDGQVVQATASMGIVLRASNSNNSDSETVDDLLRNADMAMYRAKALGRAQYAFFNAAMQEQVLNRLQLEADLKQVIKTLTPESSLSKDENLELYLVYQPIIEIDTQKLAGVEALVRWCHPQQALIPPSKFIPIAEKNGMIETIGDWVLRTACYQWVEWQQIAEVSPSFSISVNLSGQQLLQTDLIEQIQQILADTQLPPTSLKLELTESTLIDQEETVIAILHTLQDIGIQLAIDDFGTGYSSLSYLHNLPIDIVKIDRQFIQGVDVDPKKLILVQSITALAENLNLEVVAEGIETTQQLTQLTSLPCRYGQGYLYSPPVSGDKIALFLIH